MKNNYHMLRSTLQILLVLCISVISFGASAQSDSPAERVLFIQIDNLDPDQYFKIKSAINENDQIMIKQACVPAEVIMFSFPASNRMTLDENFNQIKGTVLENTNLTAVSILAEYSEQDFLERCQMYRTQTGDNQ